MKRSSDSLPPSRARFARSVRAPVGPGRGWARRGCLQVGFALAFAVGVAVGGPASAARAGDRQLEVLLVNMAPAPTAEGRACFDHVRRRLAEDYTVIRRLGETPLLRQVGRESGRGFLEWPAELLEPVKQAGDRWFDAIVLVDCRPETRTADVLVTSPSGGVTRMRLRRMELDRARARWLAEAILRHGWVGFVP